jgi:chromosomal replication initiation ATPase DnaA
MNTELHRQHEANKDRQLRMLKAANSNGEVERLHRQLRLKETQLQGIQHELDAKTARIRDLEIGLADAQARVLSQAHIISELHGSDLMDEEDYRRPVPDIINEVLRDYPDVTWKDIISVRRSRNLIQPRHACMKAVYDQRKDLSSPMIGRLFNRGHETILYAAGRLANKQSRQIRNGE